MKKAYFYILFTLTFILIIALQEIGPIGRVATAHDVAAPLNGSQSDSKLKTTDAQLTQYLSDQIAQATAYQHQGLYRRSRKQLEAIQQSLQQAPDSIIKVKGLLQLANILSLTGGENAQALLDQALSISHNLDPKNTISVPEGSAKGLTALTHFHQGNFHLFHNQPLKAKADYDEALKHQSNPTLKLMIEVRLLELQFARAAAKPVAKPEIRSKAQSTEQSTGQSNTQFSISREQLSISWSALLEKINTSPFTSETLYLRLELAELALERPRILSSELIQPLLVESLQVANYLDDRQATTSILGYLGQLHLESGRLDLADRNAHQALQMAQRSRNSNLTYRNFRLLGQIEARRHHLEQAKHYYQSATDTLQQIRFDLVATSPNLRFEFREEVEPIYRELVDLLLTPTDQKPISQSQLKQAQTVMDSLRDAELVNYFREACWDVSPQAIENLDPTAAVIYPIVLADRLEVIWNLPGQPLQHHSIPVSQTLVETRVAQMRQALRSTSLSAERRPLEQELYNWLIRPALSQIQANPGIKTLVFNPDTAFQLVPMTVLHDGKQYLIEQYAIATTPGLKLRPGQALSKVPWKGDRSFVGGISEAQGESIALPGVMEELDTIDRQIKSAPHRNNNLTLIEIKTALAKTPIALLHLATHGQFSATPDETFLQLWDDRLTVKNLGILFEERTINGLPPLELLILSACQTAQGDRRAALGIAGIAVQSGARSTIASLWTVDDGSTAQLMQHLYQNLDQNLPRAEALRQAQLRILKDPEFSHPYYWSAFTLLGAWG
jgi:CHAT domain-containing protein